MAPNGFPRPGHDSSGSDGALLEGLVVIDLIDDNVEASTRILADLGAEVIKVESPSGATSRTRGPHANDGSSIYSMVRNANKRGVVVDLELAEDREFLWALVASADILIEDRHLELSAAGFTPEKLSEHNPRLVHVTVSDFGLTGPYSTFAGTDPVHLALATQLSRSGVPGREPLVPPGYMSHEAAAFHVAWAALVAYFAQLSSGVGDHIDLSIYDVTVQTLDPPFGTSGTAASAIAGKAGAIVERGRPTSNSYPTFRCEDGFVRLAILAPRQWYAMWDWLGRPDHLSDPALASTVTRIERQDELYPLYQQLCKGRKKAELAAEAQARGVPMAPIASIADVLDDESWAEAGTFVDVEIAEGITERFPSGYFIVDGVRRGIRTRSPRIGEHTAQVRASLASGSATPHSLETGSAPPPERPLAGVRVIDFGVFIVGSEVGRLLADMGADVIKVENRAFPDGARVAVPGGMHQTFAVGHRNKRSFGVNMRTPEGVEVIKDLVRGADVVVSNFKPGTLEKLGLGYDELSRVNPQLVWSSSSGFGEKGRRREWLGYGPLVRAASGLASQWRHPDSETAFGDMTTIYPDHFAGRVVAVAVLAALVRRSRTGQGADVRVAQGEAAINHTAEWFVRESHTPGSVHAPGNISEVSAPWNVYPCAGEDEWCVITVRDDVEWQRFKRALGEPSWAADPRFDTAAGRVEHREQIDLRVADWTRTVTPRQAMESLQEHGVPSGAMVRMSELAADAHLVARGVIGLMDQPGLDGPLRCETAPFKSRHIAPPEHRPAPLQGEHTVEICEEVIGMSSSEITLLIDAGVLEPYIAKNDVA